jgi:hypothetical protein
MGYGVLAGTMTGTMLASATPASAHQTELRAEGVGAVFIAYIGGTHAQMLVWDFNCSDGVTVQGSVKVNPESPIIRSTQTSCVDAGLTIPAGAYLFRKCLLGSGNVGCSEWTPL